MYCIQAPVSTVSNNNDDLRDSAHHNWLNKQLFVTLNGFPNYYLYSFMSVLHSLHTMNLLQIEKQCFYTTVKDTKDKS